MKSYAAVVAVLLLAACGGPMDESSQQENLGSQSSALIQLTGHYYLGVDGRYQLEFDGSGGAAYTSVAPSPWNECVGVGDPVYTGLTLYSSNPYSTAYTGTRYVYSCYTGVTAHSVYIEVSCSSSTACSFYEHISGVNSYGWTRFYP
jgi:hypothetical protein